MNYKKYEVILFQPYLRKFVLNFGNNLKNFTFHNIANPPIAGGGYNRLPVFEKEIKRRKTHWKNRLRRILGIPNVRIYFNKKGDILFTYGCLVLTNKPYCTYIETGLAFYNYDLGIAKNPIARLIANFLMTRSSCKKLIFVSEASKKSFYSTIKYSKKVQKILEAKSIVIYPIPIEKKNTHIKCFDGTIKLLFPGTFYMKGGMELAHAYEVLRDKYSNVNLTVVTALHMLNKNDAAYLQSLPGLTLIDAKLNEQQMIDIYCSHDILVLPTYREGFGLVLVEAISYGMPLIITDQYATREMAIEKFNGFIYPNHPLKDYDPQTYRLLGKYYNPSDFYQDLFKLQRLGQMNPIEDFLVSAIEQYLKNPDLLKNHSKNSLELYDKKFSAEKLSNQIETVFLDAITPANK